MPVQIAPLADYLTVRLEPMPRPSSILHTPEPVYPLTRWATIEALGPRIAGLSIGQRCLVSLHQGIAVSDSILLPYSAVLLTD